jgi:hypothetical protein
MIGNSRRRSPSIRRPKVYKQMERPGRNLRPAGTVLTVIPPASSAGTRCAKVGGPGFRSVGAEMTGEEG